jgi:hypothetical protein
MRRRAKTKTLALEVVILLMLVAAAVTEFVHSELKPMDKDEIKNEASDLRSFASAGRQLAEQHLAGQTTSTFFQSQSSLLEDKAHASKKSLESSKAEKGMELKLWEARHLAGQVEAALDSLDGTPDLNEPKEELRSLAEQLKHLEDQLKQPAQ